MKCKMERFCDIVRAGGTVAGHIAGQASKIGLAILPQTQNLNESESQQLCESFGRVAPIVLCEKISTTLTENLLQTIIKSPWELTKIRPTMRIFTRETDGESYDEVECEEDPDAFIARLVKLKVFETTRAVFITHGFVHDINIGWLTEMKNALLSVENLTVIIVGWGGGSNIGIDRYDHATRNIETVGCWIANYIRQMKRHNPDFYIWGVGHSLGSHLFGFAAKCSKGAFDRITGMDPAGPNFEIQQFNTTRLGASDAKIVDVIHTDGYAPPRSIQAITSPTNHYGTLVPMGTIDFYPNWGHSQPGCSLSVIGSHNRAFELFIKSITSSPGTFKTNMQLVEVPSYMSVTEEAKMTDEEVEMGFYCKGGSGNYYFDLTAKESWLDGIFIFP